MTVLDYPRYEGLLTKAQAALNQYHTDRQALANHPDYSDEYKQTQLAKLDASHPAKVNEHLADAQQALEVHVTKAQNAAKPVDIPYDRRTYEATAAAQDLAASKTPDAMIAHYEKAAADGNRARMAELHRLANPTLDEADPVRWRSVIARNRTDKERAAVAAEAAGKNYAETIKTLGGLMNLDMERIPNGSAPSPTVNDAILATARDHAERDAAQAIRAPDGSPIPQPAG